MATTTTTPRRSGEIVPGMVIRINVPTQKWRTDFDCEVLEVKKIRTGGATKYGIRIQEPPVPGRGGKSWRYFGPRDIVQVVTTQEGGE